ncbi:unnamed protein product [Linum trigynum]|uniref:Aminopeptidase n=2 Tax=Linum trigynum TaxID=586398 RepID=A0AAV2DT43_9ROSI
MEKKQQKKIMEQEFKGQTRLPKFAIPKSYNLYLQPDLFACNFSGTVEIRLTITEPSSFMVLNSLELKIHEASFTSESNNQKYLPFDVLVDDEDEILVLPFDVPISVGDGVLKIDFSGSLNEHLRGFYRCTYLDGETKKNMVATQFEAVDARRCFPCWDEPALKATFRVAIDAPVELTALSNMPVADETIHGNIKTVTFQESPLMSTYLVAVVLGVFDHVEQTTSDGIKVRVYCPKGKRDEGTYALSLAVKSLDLFSQYFSMAYPLPKLDMVAVPEFSGGAMENNGLIIFRENELLQNDLISSASRKQRLAIVMAHEVAHHWFGNLVTMEWWTHLWLNEGFATWISYLATDIMFPEWKIWAQFLQMVTSGLRIDALQGSHPIEIEVKYARLVNETFDDVCYKKGSSVVRMLQGYLGDAIFQKSLSAYMKRYAWGNAKTEDLWSVLSEVSGVRVNSMMDSWTKQKGYPVISVKLKDQFLEFEQAQFLSSGQASNAANWIVPITLILGSYKRRKTFLLETEVGRFHLSDLDQSSNGDPISFGEDLWIKVNVEQSGFYRVKYENKLSARLKKAVVDNQLSATDKFGILDDVFALCESCELPLSNLLSLMDVYRKELDYALLSRLMDICYSILEVSTDAIPGSVNDLKAFFISLLQFSAGKLGWESVPGESHLDALLRGEILLTLAVLGHDGTINKAMNRFEAFLNDRNTPFLSADTRKAAYVAAMRNSNSTNTKRDGFESLLKIYRESDAVQEKERVLRCIATSSDPEVVEDALNLLVSDAVRDQDIVYGLAGISLEGREMAWRWLKEKWSFILNKYGDGLLITHFVRDIISPFCSHEKADEIETFFTEHGTGAIEMNLKQSIEKVRIKARWAESIVKQESSIEELVQQLTYSNK